MVVGVFSSTLHGNVTNKKRLINEEAPSRIIAHKKKFELNKPPSQLVGLRWLLFMAQWNLKVTLTNSNC